MSRTNQPDPPSVLVADIGGTNTRFGIVDADGALRRRLELRSDDFPGPAEAALRFLEGVPEGEKPRRGVLAVACPVTGDRVRLTNRSWDFSLDEMRLSLGLDELRAINDFAALALSLPVLGEGDLRRVKAGTRATGASMALLGPGTGLGVAGLLPAAGAWWPVLSEGGHRDLAVAADDREWQVYRVLFRQRGHVSAEDVLSGPGLVQLASALRELEGRPEEDLTPPLVVERARADADSIEAETVRLFSTWLGAVAGDLALILDARGGVFVGGGILPKMGELFDEDAFRRRFLAKGRYREYLEDIPIDLILHPTAALLGAARLLDLEPGHGGGPTGFSTG